MPNGNKCSQMLMKLSPVGLKVYWTMNFTSSLRLGLSRISHEGRLCISTCIYLRKKFICFLRTIHFFRLRVKLTITFAPLARKENVSVRKSKVTKKYLKEILLPSIIGIFLIVISIIVVILNKHRWQKTKLPGEWYKSSVIISCILDRLNKIIVDITGKHYGAK